MMHSDINQERHVVAIDVGSAEIRVCHSIILQDGYVNIVGYGHCQSSGINARGISSIEKLRETLSTAFSVSKKALDRVYTEKSLVDINNPMIIVSIGGSWIYGRANEGSTEVHRQVTHRDMEVAYNNCRALNKKDFQLITSCVNCYQVDENEHVEEPLAMMGGQLKVLSYLIYGNSSYIGNLKQCIDFIQTNLQCEFASTGFSAANAVVDENEKKLGVCVLNIGASAVDICVYDKGDLVYCGSSRKASSWVTRQIAVLNSLTEENAEKLKCMHGYAWADLVTDRDLAVTAPCVGTGLETTIMIKNLAEIIESAYNEIFTEVMQELGTNIGNMNIDMAAGFVLTGGGAKIEGVDRALSEYLKQMGADITKVRRAGFLSSTITGIKDSLDPYSDAALVGMLRYSRELETHESQVTSDSVFGRFFGGICEWYKKEM